MISQSLIKLASQTKYYGLPNISKFRSTQKNKICGDIITIEVEIINQLIKKLIMKLSLVCFAKHQQVY